MKQISNEWVKVTLFTHQSLPVYWQADYAAKTVEQTRQQLFEGMQKEGMIVTDDFFMDAVEVGQLPSYVTAPVDASNMLRMLHAVGVTGLEVLIDQSSELDPYEWLGFKRVTAASKGNFGYHKDGQAHLSLVHTFYALGVKVSNQFMPYVESIQKSRSERAVYPIVDLLPGPQPAFDVLYDARYRDQLLILAKRFPAVV